MQNEKLQTQRGELEAQLERYRALYDCAPLGYLTLNREGAIGDANLACEALIGKRRDELLNQCVAQFISPDDQVVFATFLARVFESKVREWCEVKLHRSNNPPVEARIEAVASDQKECRVVLTDITAQKRAEAERLILHKLESTGVLAAGIAHDFNNLLTIMLLNLELVQPLTGGEDAKHLLEETKKAAVTASGLTRELFKFAQPESLVRQSMPLAETIPKTVELTLKDSNVQCEFSFAQDLWLAEIDAIQIAQVFRNLAQNARDAMPDGGSMGIHAENVVLAGGGKSALPPGNYVRLKVVDRGAGMAKETLPKVFDPYFSTKDRSTQKGMGLGLTICHTVIRQHGGAILAESEAGIGTEMQIYLPASKTEPTEQPLAGRPRPGRILVMDDEEPLRKVLGLTLWGLGQDVEVAEDGKLAIQLYKRARDLKRPFDVVILDLTVRGGMGGLATLQALLKIDSSVNAILMSGYADNKAMQQYERHGFKGAVRKPFNREKLRAILVQMLGGKSGSA